MQEGESAVAELPEDVLRAKVLGRLPLRDRVRARAICKYWNSLLSPSHNLFTLTGTEQEAPTWICVRRVDDVTSVWCPQSGDAFDIPSRCLFHPPWSPFPLYRILASSAGLVLAVCKESSNDPGLHLVVGNPLTQKWDKLPEPHNVYTPATKEPFDLLSLSASSASIVVDPFSGHYAVAISLPSMTIRFEAPPTNYTPLFYDSIACSWRTSEAKAPRVYFTYPAKGPGGPSCFPVLCVQLRPYCCAFCSSAEAKLLYCDDDNKCFRLGSYKGRAILIVALLDSAKYQVWELVWETATTWKAKDISTFTDVDHSLGALMPEFMFEGDYVVGFAERGAVAFNLHKLSWHQFHLPRPTLSLHQGSCILKPCLP